MNFNQYDREYLQEIVKESTSLSEVLRKLNKSIGGNNIKLKKYLKDNNFDMSTLIGRTIKRYSNKGIPMKKLSEVLCENSTGNSHKLKLRLFKSGIKECKCEKCGNIEWNGQPIPLELHHINGNHYDNRLENLIILCPNCHAQTHNYRSKNLTYDVELSLIAKNKSIEEYKKIKELENKQELYKPKTILRKIVPKEKKYCKYCGKEIKGKGKYYCSTECAASASRKNEYDKEILLEQSKTVPSLIQLSKLYNLTDNALKKHLKFLGIYDEIKQNFKSIDRKILQYDLNENFIKEWDSVSLITKELGFPKSNILKVCRNYNKTSHGYIWRYKD